MAWGKTMNQGVLVLLPPLILFVVSLFVVAKRYRNFVEEDHLGEIKLVSPALKLVKNIVKKSFMSIEMIMIFLSLYILAINSSYATTFSFSSHSLEVEPPYTLLAVSDGIVPLPIFNEILNQYVTIVQIFTPLSINGTDTYLLLIKCNLNRTHNINNELIAVLSAYCVNEDTILIDTRSNIPEDSIIKLLGKYNIARADMIPLSDIELIPGVYVIHSIGTIGGLSLKIENTEKLIVMPLTESVTKHICSRGCSAKTIIVGLDDRSLYKDSLDYLVTIFNYVALREPPYPEVKVYSRFYVPTAKSIVSLIISFIISVIVVYAVSGGLIEKLISMGHALFIEGITKELFIAIVALGVMLTTISMFIPISILFSLGLLKGTAVITYLVSSIGSTYIITSRLSNSIGKYKPQNVSNTFSYIVDRYVPSGILAGCLKSFLVNDDFFNIDEVESVTEENYYMIRIEMIYRRALTTVSSVEIYVDRVDHGVKYTVVVDVWSIEDLSSRTLSSIQRLTLSKVVGGVISCIES